MNNQEIKDKAIFVVGLFGIFFALTIYKTQLSSIIALTNGTRTFSLWQLLELLIGCLMISVYLYALSYVFGKHTNNHLYKTVVFLGDFFYAFALVYPLFVVFASLIISSPLGSYSKEHSIGLAIFDIVGTLGIIILSILNAKGKINFNPLGKNQK